MSYENLCSGILDVVNDKFLSIKRDLKLKPRKLRVGHYVTTPQQYFPSLAESFLKKFDFVDYTILYSGFDLDYFKFFSSKGGEVIHAGERDAVLSKNFDILFIQHPYYNISKVEVDFYGIMRRLPEYILSDDFSKQPLLCFVPYAFTVIDEKCHSPVNGFQNLPVHNCAWRVFCETEYHLEKANNNSINKGLNWIVSGYPKVDNVCPVFDSIETDSDLVLIWAPHHNPSFQGVGIAEVHRFLATLVEKHDHLKVVFRPHPNLLTIDEESFKRLNISKPDFENICDFWASHHKGKFDMGADLSLLFEDSTLMLTDCGGFQVEYLSTGKPLVSYIKRNILNDFSLKIIDEVGYHCANLNEIQSTLHDLIFERNDRKSKFRPKALGVLKPYDSASEFIVNHIYEQFFGD